MPGPRFLLDTNICIYIAKQHPPEVLSRFRRLKPGELCMSAITFGELLYGAARSSRRDEAIKTLHQLTTLIPVLALAAEVGEHYGAIRAELEESGRPIGNNDLWIAAHAREQELTLVTNNEREFKRVRGLKIQNWVK